MRGTLCLLLCLTAAHPSAAAVVANGNNAPPPRRGSHRAAASQEDVNVLMYGVLQFSETLHHIYQTTQAKMERVARSLRAHEGALESLGREAARGAVADGQIKETLGRLQAQMDGLRAEAERTRGRLAGAQEGETELKRQVTHLETNLANSAPDRVKDLQERATKHAGILRVLTRWNQRQKQNLELQNRRLAKLQTLSADMT